MNKQSRALPMFIAKLLFVTGFNCQMPYKKVTGNYRLLMNDKVFINPDNQHNTLYMIKSTSVKQLTNTLHVAV